MRLYDGSKEAWAGYQQVTAMRAALAELVRSNPPADVAAAATALDAKLLSVGGRPAVGRGGGGGGGRGAPAGPPPPPNFAAINAVMNRQLNSFDAGDSAPNEAMLKSYAFACAELRTAVGDWKTLNGQDLVALNAMLVKNAVRPIAVASQPLSVPVCSSAAR